MSIDEMIRERMQDTGESYETAAQMLMLARDIEAAKREREDIVVAIRMWARSYPDRTAIYIYTLADRLERLEHRRA